MLPAIVVGLTFHEYAHGLVAHWLGLHSRLYTNSKEDIR